MRERAGGRRGWQWLRWVPPVAALGTAFVLQVVLVTDMLGAAIAERMSDLYPDLAQSWVWFAVAALLGLAVASSLEGSAAWLMHLYDQHLRTRDSVWLLRLGMLLYVALSAAMIHWWLSARGLPELLAWILAAMSGSALFLWSRGSRWRHRRQMLAAGQIDPALPRLPTPTKLLHPLRSMVTIWLITWGPPVRTVDGARRRYEAWRRLRRTRRQSRSTRRLRRRTRTAGSGRGRGAVGRRVADGAVLARLRHEFPQQLPSLNQVQRLAGGGRSRAVRLRSRLAGSGEKSPE
jgi:hypothetical protein